MIQPARSHAPRPTALGAWPRWLQLGLAVVFADILLALSAHVQVPFWPVPMTLETLVVLAIGAFYAPALATATVGAFLLEGLAGLPVFAHGGGPAYLMGPTGGYLVGYLVAAALLSALTVRGRRRTMPRLLLAMTVADAVVFALGFAWLALLIGPDKAWLAGVLPFLPADALKIVLAAATVRAGDAWMAQRGG